MSGFDLLWVFFVLSAVQPLIRQRWLEVTRASRSGLPARVGVS
jgi:hypothetical protein